MSGIDYKEYTKKQFARSSKEYDLSDAYEMCRNDYPAILMELQKEPFHMLLDCGCGTGAMLEIIHDHYPEGAYYGIDLTPEMIDKAEERKLPQTVFQVGDCEDLPYDSEMFDEVICSHSFHHYPQPEKFFASVYRVLKPDGRLIIRDNTGPWWWLLNMNLRHIPRNNRLLHYGDVKFYSKHEMKRFAKKSGLVMEIFEEHEGHKMHCVMRKRKDR